LQGTHPALESSNKIKKGKGKDEEMVQTRSYRRGSGGGAPGSAGSVGRSSGGAPGGELTASVARRVAIGPSKPRPRPIATAI